MKLYHFLILSGVFWPIFSGAQLPTQNILSSEILQQLKHAPVVKTYKVKGAPWPKIDVYISIQASALDSVAVYYALEYQQEYVPDLLQSKPVKQISPTEIYTRYRYHVPWPFTDSIYVNGSKLEKNGSDYSVNWYMVENDSADEVYGKATFIDHGGETILHYENFVKPKAFLAILLKRIPRTNTLAAVQAIKAQIEKLRTQNSLLLNLFRQRIEDALKGKYPYRKIVEANLQKEDKITP